VTQPAVVASIPKTKPRKAAETVLCSMIVPRLIDPQNATAFQDPAATAC